MFIYSIGLMNFKTFPSNLVMKTKLIFFKSLKNEDFSQLFKVYLINFTTLRDGASLFIVVHL